MRSRADNLARHGPVVVAVVVLAMVAVACSGNPSPNESSSAFDNGRREEPGTFTAQVASYDLAFARVQRVTVGLIAEEQGLVAYGSVEMTFVPLDDDDSPLPQFGLQVTGEFVAVPGHRIEVGATRPRIVSPSDMVGVYAAEVRFDRAGRWGVSITGEADGRPLRASTTLEVLEANQVPVPGDPAPETVNHLPGAAGVPPAAIDSRADDDGTIPDPELHRQTVAEAVRSGEPTMVVISTPVYCQSRFCGPITETVERLAAAHGTRMNFIHLEVWRDFAGQAINKAAAEWIYRTPPQEINEPWVFILSPGGQITERYDNVVSDEELAASVDRALG